MTDIKTGPNPLFLREEELRQAIEMLFFAYRDFTAEPDQILAQYGFGRAHHRVIYFVGCHPRITVSELLAILAITKQSLSRVLGQLVAEGFVDQRPGERDRRQRLLDLTESGRELERRLTENQRNASRARFARPAPRRSRASTGCCSTSSTSAIATASITARKAPDARPRRAAPPGAERPVPPSQSGLSARRNDPNRIGFRQYGTRPYNRRP